MCGCAALFQLSVSPDVRILIAMEMVGAGNEIANQFIFNSSNKA
jgi:hypothetical protein